MIDLDEENKKEQAENPKEWLLMESMLKINTYLASYWHYADLICDRFYGRLDRVFWNFFSPFMY